MGEVFIVAHGGLEVNVEPLDFFFNFAYTIALKGDFLCSVFHI